MRRDKIFICYRRTTDNAARMLQTALKQKFGDKVVFLDVDHIEPGVDFVNRLQGQIAETAAMVVVIGRDWLTLSNADGGRRIDDPLDPVHVEVAAALFSGIDIFPALVDGATMPSEDELPLMLRPFARRNARKVPVDEFFPTAMEGLTKAIGQSLRKARGPRLASLFGIAGWCVGAVGLALTLWVATIGPPNVNHPETIGEAPSVHSPEPTGDGHNERGTSTDGRSIEYRIEETEPNDEIFSAMSIGPGELLEARTSDGRDEVDYICTQDGVGPGEDFDLIYAVNSPNKTFTVEAFQANGARAYSFFTQDHTIRATISTGPLCLAVHQNGGGIMNYRIALTKADPK